jgi:hypothetical protein
MLQQNASSALLQTHVRLLSEFRCPFYYWFSFMCHETETHACLFSEQAENISLHTYMRATVTHALHCCSIGVCVRACMQSDMALPAEPPLVHAFALLLQRLSHCLTGIYILLFTTHRRLFSVGKKRKTKY